jgi:primosomal protein N' (replication factor Y)
MPVGHGTQRLEATLAELFPQAKILRIDRDSTRRKQSFEKMLDQINKGEADILIGTQMLAKGHDFAKLSLVGILGSDNALYSSDFRAPENLFSQLLQVGGRAGRANIGGEVLIQTNFPDHFLYQALRAHDYTQFADYLLNERKRAGFPPFVHQALLRAEAPKLKSVLDFLEEARTISQQLNYPVTLYDPVPAPLARRAGKERAHLLIQSASRPSLQSFLKEWLKSFSDKPTHRVRWSIDVDPLDFN